MMNYFSGKMSIFDDSVTLMAGDDSVQVSAYGAHILSWKVDNTERLWLSSLSATDMSAPVCASLYCTAVFLY
jgi:D-hexose-6-phosphate mutarotase